MDVDKEPLDQDEGLFMVSFRACLEIVKRPFSATYKRFLSLIVEDLKASPRPSQYLKRLYQLLSSKDPHGFCQPVPRLDRTLKASTDAMSIALAESVKNQQWKSR